MGLDFTFYLPEFIHLFGISFKPEVFYSLFKIAPYELNDLKTRQLNSLALLTYKHQFYDQAHLINTFKRLTGMRPSQVKELYLPQRNAEQKGYSLSYSGKS